MGIERNAGRGIDGSCTRRQGPADDRRPPGHVEFDGRGNSVWCWDREQGDSTSILLKRLHNDSLQLEPTRPVPILGKRRQDAKRPARARDGSADDIALEDTSSGGGFDPYNHR